MTGSGRSAVVQVIPFAKTSLALSQGWTSNSTNPQFRCILLNHFECDFSARVAGLDELLGAARF
jgi:hypothetical protein